MITVYRRRRAPVARFLGRLAWLVAGFTGAAVIAALVAGVAWAWRL